MRNTMLASGTRRAALGVFLAAMMVATLLAAVAQQSAAAQDDLAIIGVEDPDHPAHQ